MKFNIVVVLFLLASASPGLAGGRALTATDVVNLEGASSPRIFPGGHELVYSVRSTDYAANKYLSSIWLMQLDVRPDARRLASSDGGASSPRWSSDGKSIYFLSERSGTRQAWKTDAAGTVALQVTKLPLAVGVFKLSPDGLHIVVSMSVFPDCESPECTAQRQKERSAAKATGEAFTRLFVRQDYEWEDGTRNHLFVLSLDTSGVVSGLPIALMPHFDGDCPRWTWSSDDDFDISHDGKSIYFSSQIAGQNEPWTYNRDICRVPIDGTPALVNMTSGNLAADAAPTISPDTLAYLSQIPGINPAVARYHIQLVDLKTRITRELASDWEASPMNIGWRHDGRSVLANILDNGSA